VRIHQAAPKARESQMFGRFVPKAWPLSTKPVEPVLSSVSDCAMLQKMHQQII
jgi:hypothetical protein